MKIDLRGGGGGMRAPLLGLPKSDHVYCRWPRSRYRPIYISVDYRLTIDRLSVDSRLTIGR